MGSIEIKFERIIDMKHTLLTLFAVVAVFTLSACETIGFHDDGPPYSSERTAIGTQKLATVDEAPAVQECAPAPVCESCTDVAPLRARINELENLLARCQEGKSRVQESYREELSK